jgi:hypothetical protein
MKVNSVVKSTHPEAEQMPKTRVTMAEIGEVKRRHIERCLLYSPEEAGQVLGKSAQTIIKLVKEGALIAADKSAAKGKGSNSLSITAESLEKYRQSIIVPAEFWAQ